VLRESLGERLVAAYFPQADSRLPELVTAALWWLGGATRLRLSLDQTLPASGILSLTSGPAARIQSVVHVVQDGKVFTEARNDWSAGTPVVRGSWLVQERVFYAIGLAARIPGLEVPAVTGSWWASGLPYPLHPLLGGTDALKAGTITLVHYGVPLEADLGDNELLRQAALEWALGAAYDEIVSQAGSPRRIKMEGVPEVFDNTTALQKFADARRMAAERMLSRYSSAVI
jgi:hypothetical protein